MGYYKVPQDVEAEDKLLGPFTFKQFIFLIVTIIGGFVAFQLAVTVNFIVALPLLPFLFVTGLIGVYRPKDQPIENKVLAYLNFWFKPRKRVWSRDGIVEHVRIKAPKKIERNYSDGRSQDQVRSQLQQLAQVVDTRGWSSKRSDLQEPGLSFLSGGGRLVQPSEVTVITNDADDISDADDIYDQAANPVAQAFEQRTAQSEQASRQALLARLREQADNAAASNDQTKTVVADKPYVNPYEPETAEPPNALKPVTSTKPDPQRAQRLKELESSNLSVSRVAERAQEMKIDRSDSDGELTIEH